MHQAFALVRNFSASVERLDFGYFSLTSVGSTNIEEIKKMFATQEVYQGDWVYGKGYPELPPGPTHSPAGVGGIPDDVEDMLFLLRLYKVGDISFVRQCIVTPDEKQLIQAPYRVINEGNSDSIFTTEFTRAECEPFMEFANDLRKSLSWTAPWFLVARRFFLYGGAKEFSPKWDEVDRIVDYATALEAILVHEMDFLRRRTSQRAAKLVAPHDAERSAAIVKIVKKVYDIRSSIVHGSVFSEKDREWLFNNCGEVELCVRQVLVSALQKMPPTEEDHRRFLTGLFDIADGDRRDITMQKFHEIETTTAREEVREKIAEFIGVHQEKAQEFPPAPPMPPIPYIPSHDDRVKAVRHVVHEYANLMSAAHHSLCGQAPWRSHCDDAFLLGCRKMDDFLMRPKRSVPCDGKEELDDILALDYLPDGFTITWKLPIWKKHWRWPMNKQLAHLAYSRDKEWNHLVWVRPLRAEFQQAWADFLAAVIDNDYRDAFTEQLHLKQDFIDLP